MVKRGTLLLGFSALLAFGVLTLILTHAELTALDLTRPGGGELGHANIAEEWQTEDRDVLRARQNTRAKGQPAVGLNVGRVLAKYDSDSDERAVVNRDAATAQTSPTAHTSPRSHRHSEENPTATVQKQKIDAQMLYQRQLELHLNWTAGVISSSSHFRDVQQRLNELADLKITELRLDTATKELWLYLRDQIKTINFTKADATDPDELKLKLLFSIKEQLDLLSLHATSMQSIVDSYINKGWREKMSTELSQLIQMRLHHLQNPPSCRGAKKLLCRLSKPCGFGCQIHHVAYCFIFAYATERMLILDPTGWRYISNWEAVFQPLHSSHNCTTQGMTGDHWTTYKYVNPPEMIQVPAVDSLGSHRPSFLPMAVPRDIADRLKVFHGYPFVWFIGEFLQYLMRPSLKLQQYLDERRAYLNISHPIVGVHIRRTDKLNQEASYHSVQEYMIQVEEWYDSRRTLLGVEGEERRVYLATDDRSALKEAVQAYPDYRFISDNDVSKTAGDLKNRYSEKGLFGVVLDVLMLSECDYIICTLSSQVCRLAYELMQRHHTDASRLVYSLDDVYYYGGQQEHHLRSFYHRTEQDGGKLDFSEGDLIKTAGNHHNGFSLGNRKNNPFRELFPSYKVEEEVLVADFPSYPNVRL